ncbi:Sulfur carrier protein adenylyltransferase ThiF [Methylophaga frappieri]|uniref:Molybdopterin-synthase adenylyltransferase n=1 Tax=Methylophaga frappieri (strain ATCC BAA-2434 / DSM 25690 / JAM7) TaxID=754477 RepID=I1YKF6_METFJ|nr:molybdopterin-synthase adenylyltransferase MoeB [Methylophaga frappieri]AFJ03399.1 Sulfur carrier protein adenylyltransferase ThiF [Methylophaga frappieri]
MNDQQLLRYGRHILLPHLEYEGQQRLLASRVMVIGLGGLGSPVALYLAASGVGELVLVDDDTVALSNLQRQILHQTNSVGELKTVSAAARLSDLNPEIKLQLIPERLNAARLRAQLAKTDVMVDCTDSFASRFLLNQLSQETKTPLVSAAAIRWEAHITVFDPREATAGCYRCLYNDEQADTEQRCAESGVLSPLLGVMGSLQAVETIKLLTASGQTLTGRMLVVDALTMQLREIRLSPDPACPVCQSSGKKL